jgi:hypothetical protein
VITSLQEITVTVRLSTRCGSRLTCDSYGKTCEQCLQQEIQRKLGDNGHLPHFKLQNLTLEIKEITQQSWQPPEPETKTVIIPPPKVTVEYSPTGRGRPMVDHGAVTVFYFHHRGKAWGPYYKLRSRRIGCRTEAGYSITWQEAEKLVPTEILEEKARQARNSLFRKHPGIVLKLSKNSEG